MIRQRRGRSVTKKAFRPPAPSSSDVASALRAELSSRRLDATSNTDASPRRHDDVILLPFAQQQMLAEEQIVRGDGARRVRFADVVQVNAAAFNVLSRLTFRRTQARVHEQFDQSHAG